MDKKDLELQYSPSRWSQRFKDPDEVIQRHVQFVTKASSEARSNIPVELGVRYGLKEGQLLDIFGGESLPNDCPILVYIHGGYWQELSRDLSAYCVEPQFEAGVRVVVVGYDLSPSVMIEDIIEEIKEAATYIVNMAVKHGVRSVLFSGHSAGAHLVSMLLFSGWLDQLDANLHSVVKGCVLISGVYDLTPLVNTYVNDALNMTGEYAKMCSPLLLSIDSPAAKQLQVLVTVGEHDSPEFKRQSYDFTQKLIQLGVQVKHDVLPDVDHFDIVEKLLMKNYPLTLNILEMFKKFEAVTS